MATAVGLRSDQRSDRRRPRLAAVRRALHVAWAIALVGMLMAAGATTVASTVFDLVPLAVVSGSMEPAMPAHSLILVEEIDPAAVRVGEIISFDPPGPTPRVTHRVVSRSRSGSHWYFGTKGDANPAVDDWRRGLDDPERYRREISYGDAPAVRLVATIPYLGYVAKLGAVPWLRSVLVVLPFALIGVCLLLAIWRRSTGP